MNRRRQSRKKITASFKRFKKGPVFILLFCILGLLGSTIYILSPKNNIPTVKNTSNPTSTPPIKNDPPAAITPPSSRFSNVSENDAAPRIPVLMYHDVQDIQKTTNNNVMPTATFEEELKWLKDNNFTTITVQEFMDAYQNKIFLPKKSVLITLDDGFKSIKTIVNPLLKKYDMHAVSFIIGSYKERSQWHLTETEIQEVDQDKRIAFESHTYDLHKDGKKRGLINETPIDEIVNDNIKNEQIIHHKTNMFCYPFGAYSDNSINGLKKANIPFAFAIKAGKANWVELNKTKTSPFGDVQNPLALPRVRINGNISLDTFKALVTDSIK